MDTPVYQSPLIGERPYRFFVAERIKAGAHWHAEIEVLWCIDGKLTVGISGKQYELLCGDVAFVSNTSEHYLNAEFGRCLVIEFGYLLMGSEFAEMSRKRFSVPVMHISEENPIHSVFTRLLNEDPYTAEDRWMITGLIFELAAHIRRIIPMYDETDGERKKRIANIEKLHAALDLINKKYSTQLTVADAALAVGYEKSSFCRLFKQTTGYGFLEYLNRYRVSIAETLLKENELSIQSVAALTGFPVPKTFCRVFKQYTDQTPTEYRRKYASGNKHTQCR